MDTKFAFELLRDDVLRLYHDSFPEDERQPDDEVRALSQEGLIVIHTTRDVEGKLIAFSFTSLHAMVPSVNLDFISVAANIRGCGEGSRHFQHLLDWVRSDPTGWTALTLEMERRGLPDLTDAESAQRQARARFYTRLGATQQPVDYNILNFEDAADRIPAEFWAVVLTDEFDLERTVVGFYTSPAGYDRHADDSAVHELRVQFDAQNEK